MKKKSHLPAPVPRGNRRDGQADAADTGTVPPNEPGDGTGFQEQDPKRRLGDFTGAGEHARQQPGGKHGADKK